jgi:hypothetical protein
MAGMGRVAVIVPLVEGADDRARALLAAGPPWAGTSEWAEIVAGAPFIAPDVYAGSQQDELSGVSYEATPGPGDSEGGDVFPPQRRSR